MRRLLFLTTTLLTVLLFASTAFADWTLQISRVSVVPDYIYWKVVCTSDGSAMAATDLLADMDPQLLQELQGTTMLVMDVKPGTGGVAPSATITVTLSNSLVEIYENATAFAYDADTVGNKLNEDYNMFPPVLGQLKLAISDIGDSGDQVTLIFLCWIDKKK